MRGGAEPPAGKMHSHPRHRDTPLARVQVCRNDLLNFGRMHFFLPGDRMSLDLTTDTVVKEARFDRHFVRDMTWSRHQLTQLAERRFCAAQQKVSVDGQPHPMPKPDEEMTAFSDLLREARALHLAFQWPAVPCCLNIAFMHSTFAHCWVFHTGFGCHA